MHTEETGKEEIQLTREEIQKYFTGYVVRPDGLKEEYHVKVKDKTIRLELDIAAEEFKGLPKPAKEEELVAFDFICEQIQNLPTKKRKLIKGGVTPEETANMPLLKAELLESGFDKRLLRNLERLGLIGTKTIVFTSHDGTKSYGGWAVVFLTALGKSLENTRKNEK